jgi:integral membrane sensor domain MASE1
MQPSIVKETGKSKPSSLRHSWISTAIAILAIAATALLCFESFVEADRSLERWPATTNQAGKTGAH